MTAWKLAQGLRFPQPQDLDTEYAEGLGAMNDTSPQEIGWEMYSKEN